MTAMTLCFKIKSHFVLFLVFLYLFMKNVCVSALK